MNAPTPTMQQVDGTDPNTDLRTPYPMPNPRASAIQFLLSDQPAARYSDSPLPARRPRPAFEEPAEPRPLLRGGVLNRRGVGGGTIGQNVAWLTALTAAGSSADAARGLTEGAGAYLQTRDTMRRDAFNDWIKNDTAAASENSRIDAMDTRRTSAAQRSTAQTVANRTRALGVLAKLHGQDLNAIGKAEQFYAGEYGPDSVEASTARAMREAIISGSILPGDHPDAQIADPPTEAPANAPSVAETPPLPQTIPLPTPQPRAAAPASPTRPHPTPPPSPLEVSTAPVAMYGQPPKATPPTPTQRTSLSAFLTGAGPLNSPAAPSFQYAPNTKAGARERTAFAAQARGNESEGRNARQWADFPTQQRLHAIAITKGETAVSATKAKAGRDAALFPLTVQEKRAHIQAMKDLPGYRDAMLSLAQERTAIARERANTIADPLYAGGQQVTQTPATEQYGYQEIGHDFGRNGCARFVSHVLNRAGVPISAAATSVPQLVRELVKNHKAKTEPNSNLWDPGDIIVEPSASAPSGYHVGIYAGEGQMIANPGTQNAHTVKLQNIGTAGIAYKLRPKYARGHKATTETDEEGAGPKEKATTATMMNALTEVPPEGPGLAPADFAKVLNHVKKHADAFDIPTLRDTTEYEHAKKAQRDQLEAAIRAASQGG